MRLGYLGPPGTFSEEAVRQAVPAPDAELVPFASIHDAVAMGTVVAAGLVLALVVLVGVVRPWQLRETPVAVAVA